MLTGNEIFTDKRQAVESDNLKKLKVFNGEVNDNFMVLWSSTVYERSEIYKDLELDKIFEQFPFLKEERKSAGINLVRLFCILPATFFFSLKYL